jgi:hypothetical protein
MATWKKLIVSGSEISQLNDDLGIHLSGSAGGAVDSVGTIKLGETGSLSVRTDGTYVTSSGAGQGQLTIVSGSIDTSRIALDTLEVRQISSSALVTGSLAADLTGSDDKLPTAKAVVSYVESQVGNANDLVITGSTGVATVDLSTDQLRLLTGDDSTIDVTVSKTDTTGSVTYTLNTGSDHFISGSRKTISVADTQGSAGIDLSYDSGNGILSASLQTSSIHIGDGSTSIALGETGSVFSGITATGSFSGSFIGVGSGSFSGSFEGDGSGLTGLVSTLLLTGSYDGTGTNGSVDLKTEPLTINGFVNEVSASFDDSSNTLELRLPSDVTVQNDLTVTNDVLIQNDLTVVGTASFQHTTNLEVADRFILLASGSNTAGDGGLVVQQDTQDVGELFGFDSDQERWAVTGSFTADGSAFTPDAFMAAVVEGTGTDPDATTAKYTKKGNIFVGSDESIYIYS